MERKSISIQSLFEIFLVVVLAIIVAHIIQSKIAKMHRQKALANLTQVSNTTTQNATAAQPMM